ncbi:hypothetical protein [Clostridium sp. DL1XJH146]
MKNFLIFTSVDILLILVSYFTFRAIISGPTRHRIYERFFSSFAKFVIFIFVGTVLITSVSALVLYKTRYIVYLNIIAPALVSIFIGIIISLIPTRGVGDKEK